MTSIETGLPPIPDFLLRSKNGRSNLAQPRAVNTETKYVFGDKKERSLTNSFKMKVAFDCIAMIELGHNTFGKLRKKLSLSEYFYTDREIRAGLRFGKTNWIDRPKVLKRGSKIPVLTTVKKTIKSNGKFYEVESR